MEKTRFDSSKIFAKKHLINLNLISKSTIRNSILVITLLMSSFCEIDADYEVPVPPYASTESLIRTKYDIYSVFTWNEYTNLLGLLSQDKFIVLPIDEMRKKADNSKVVVGLRHDVDFNPFKALEMSKIEKVYDIRASYYFLPTAEYYGKIVESKMVRSPGIGYLFKEISRNGAEIGIHNDLLTLLILYNIDPLKFNKEEIEFYKSLKIQIHGTAAHGSPLAKVTVPNYQVFSDFAKSDSVFYKDKWYRLGAHSLKEYGFKYEAYFITYGAYYSESGGKWNDPEGLSGIMKKLESSKPGDRIQILIHPDWWGRATN